eukprot:3833984-Pyramimonas_sp.AAC.1
MTSGAWVSLLFLPRSRPVATPGRPPSPPLDSLRDSGRTAREVRGVAVTVLWLPQKHPRLRPRGRAASERLALPQRRWHILQLKRSIVVLDDRARDLDE